MICSSSPSLLIYKVYNRDMFKQLTCSCLVSFIAASNIGFLLRPARYQQKNMDLSFIVNLREEVRTRIIYIYILWLYLYIHYSGYNTNTKRQMWSISWGNLDGDFPCRACHRFGTSWRSSLAEWATTWLWTGLEANWAGFTPRNQTIALV